MARRKMAEAEAEEPRALEPITDLQQRFIEALLSGAASNITEAAAYVGISRRTATYWLATPAVKHEYEKQRIQLRQQFYARIANLHELALKALEDALTPEAAPALRFQAARYLYESHLARFSNPSMPDSANHMVNTILEEARENSLFSNAHYLDQIED